jgi:hypothetical protein
MVVNIIIVTIQRVCTQAGNCMEGAWQRRRTPAAAAAAGDGGGGVGAAAIQCYGFSIGAA